MKECFIPRRFEAEAAAAIDQMNTIIDEYQAQGFSLTLRQLFYQFVARGLMPNTVKTYTYLGYVLRNARLAGLIDWAAIEDRTRETQRWSTWADPSELVRTAASGYAEDLSDGQTVRTFVWIEKAALVNLVEAACRDFQVPYFAVRGYNSSSEMYAAGKEFGRLISERGIAPIVLYLGDHDPSGIDMPRVADRDLKMFAGFPDVPFNIVRRIALNLDQVRQLDLPPNPAKETDQRFNAYVAEFGTEKSWELDALDPTFVDRLLRQHIAGLIDQRKRKLAVAQQKKNAAVLNKVATNWGTIARRYAS